MTAALRTALVTGAAGGIGEAISQRLARDGYEVALAGRDTQRLESLAARIRESGGHAWAHPVDISDPAGVDAMYAGIGERPAPLDVVVNCAGMALHRPLTDVSFTQWRQLVDVNTTGAFLVLQGAARSLLRAGRGGRIIAIGTGAALMGIAGRAAYGASKAGQGILVRALAMELGHAGITVNCVSPGPIDTEHARQLRTEATLRAWSQRLAIKRYGHPDEVAAAVSFLASADAGYITGETLVVDGGLMAGVEIRDGEG